MNNRILMMHNLYISKIRWCEKNHGRRMSVKEVRNFLGISNKTSITDTHVGLRHFSKHDEIGQILPLGIWRVVRSTGIQGKHGGVR